MTTIDEILKENKTMNEEWPIKIEPYARKLTWKMTKVETFYPGGGGWMLKDPMTLSENKYIVFYGSIQVGTSANENSLTIGIVRNLLKFHRVDSEGDLGVYLIDEDEIIRDYAKSKI